MTVRDGIKKSWKKSPVYPFLQKYRCYLPEIDKFTHDQLL